MKLSYRQPWLASLTVIVAAAVVGACGQLTSGEGNPAEVGAASAAPRTASVATQPEFDVCSDATSPDCTPTGAHAKHTNDCTVCHAVAGRLAFRVGGPAYPTGWTSAEARPYFDATKKTCSNVACHSIPAGTYTYTVWDWGLDELVAVDVPYGGTSQGPSPGWYSTGNGCGACHSLKVGTQPYLWHSGAHGYYMQSNKYNQCQTCHPDATGFIQTNGTFPGAVVTNPAQHQNGTLNVVPQWSASGTRCFGCH